MEAIGHKRLDHVIRTTTQLTNSYPKWVWTPTGGWWADPKYWRQNTFGIYAGFIIPGMLLTFYVSSQFEEYHRPPNRFYLSMLYGKQFQEGGKYHQEALQYRGLTKE